MIFFVISLELILFRIVNCGSLYIIPTPQPGDKITAAIDNAFFISCVSMGTNEDRPKALQWFGPNNQAIPMDISNRVYTMLIGDTLRLHFDILKPSDSGSYTCQGIEAGIPREIRVELVLQKKVTFVDTPIEQFVKEGLDAPVLCRASANPGPEISWFRKGVSVELKNDAKYQKTNDGLIIKNAQREDEGIYFCQASVVSTGEIKRLEINVQVMTAPKWVIQPKDTEGVKGQDVIIKCEAFAKPAPIYTWTRNGIILAGPRYHIQGGTLTIRNLVREDTATYSCITENNSGRLEAALHLFVLIGPEIAHMEDVHVIEGSAATVRCVVREGYPKAEIRWKYADTQQFIDGSSGPIKVLHDAKPGTSPGVIVGSWSELKFERTTRLDKRNYTCVAINKAAVAERNVQLLVEYAPKLVLNAEAREIYYSWLTVDDFGGASSGSAGGVGQSTRAYPAMFTCLADGEPKPLVTWYFKGLLIHVDNIKYRLVKDTLGFSQLEVVPKSIMDFGDYQCRAENRLGKEERNIQLLEATPPRFAPIVRVRAINPESMLFDLHPSDAPAADGGMPVEAYKLQWRLVGADFTKANEKEVPLDLSNVDLLTSNVRDVYNVEVAGLLPDTDYLFRAAAVNRPGTGVWTKNDLRVRTASRRQPDAVKVLSKEECQTISKCYVEWIVESNGGSPIRDYLIRWRRIFYKDAEAKFLDVDKFEQWSSTRVVKHPTTQYEITNLFPNSFYEVEILARNDIGPSASQPFRVKTLHGPFAETEDYIKRDEYKINLGVIIGLSIIGFIFLLLAIDLFCFMRYNCGFVALLKAFCRDEEKAADDNRPTMQTVTMSQQSYKSNNMSKYKYEYQKVTTTAVSNKNQDQEETPLPAISSS